MAEQQSVIDVQRIEIEDLERKIRDENEKFEEQSEELAFLENLLEVLSFLKRTTKIAHLLSDASIVPYL